jgi:hypothetical protein
MAISAIEEIGVGGMAIRFLLEGGQSGGSVALFEFEVPPGSPPRTATTASKRRSTASRAS